jgi:chromosome segregation ATPase
MNIEKHDKKEEVIKTSIERRLERIETDINNLNNTIVMILSEIIDIKEAFEHSDDSLQNLRISISTIKGV